MSLNKNQKAVVKSTLKAWQRVNLTKVSKPEIIRISGAGGTGKTYTVSTLLNMFLENMPRVSILVITISHNALNNFVAACDSNIPDLRKFRDSGKIEFKTIASALRQFPIRGKGFSKPQGESIGKYDIVFIDEFSNVGQSKLLPILSNLKPCSLAVFTGDKAQLPPVMDKVSEVTLATGISTVQGLRCECLDLTQQMRQTGAIDAISMKAREEIYYPTQDDTMLNHSDDVKFYSTTDELVYKAAHYVSEYGSEDVCVYSYTNKEALRIGRQIREALHDPSELISQGETLQVTKGNRELYTGSYIRMNITDTKTSYGITTFTHNGSLVVCHKSQEKKLNEVIIALIKLCEEDAKFEPLLTFYSSVVVVSYTYSKTIHSVQGVTTPYTFVNTTNIKSCRAYKKNLLYVAYSRASKELHLIED